MDSRKKTIRSHEYNMYDYTQGTKPTMDGAWGSFALLFDKTPASKKF